MKKNYQINMKIPGAKMVSNMRTKSCPQTGVRQTDGQTDGQ